MQMLTSKCSQAIAELVDLFERRRWVLVKEEQHCATAITLKSAIDLQNPYS